MPFIKVQDLEHIYPLGDGAQLAALQGIDLTIERGEFVALIGPNGSGKSTLARHFNALLLPTNGRVWIDGLLTTHRRHLWDIRQRVGMVFQNPENQFVASTVEEDIAFGPENQTLPSHEIRERVDQALSIIGLEDRRTAPPQTLSGGQKQLVAIAGALANQPDCIVFDEPTSMLDPPSRQRVLATIRQLNAKEGLTVILITQSMEEAASAHRVLAMHAGQIVMDGPPESVFEREDELQQLGLDLPPVVGIARHLRKHGMKIPTGLLTIEALTEALC